ncbi:acyltransferase [Alicyclobacillus fodiniaquatilis]|uniref:Acyltransferase n=1 Tax=Alicyclobacillus fodiniaquatilis TaxID=1661150 RepID=A0ABW4JH33_9BACL
MSSANTALAHDKPKKKRPYLLEIDLMRACIMFSVVAVHVSSFINAKTANLSHLNLSLEAALSSLHYTREAFMFITGIVLFITYYNRPTSILAFWKKRFAFIAVPYIGWTILYILFEGMYVHNFNWSIGPLSHKIFHALITGNQFFLYYVLVTMQLYVVFPALVALLRKLERHHMTLLIGSFILQIAMMVFNKEVLQVVDVYKLPGWIAWLDHYRDRFVLTYQFWFVAGGLLAIHYDKVKAWVEARRRMILYVFLGMTAILWGHLLLDRLVLHETDDMAISVLQPIMIPYSFITAVLLWQVGRIWVANQASVPSFINYILKFFSKHSFGIFLLHPFGLHYAEIVLNKLHWPHWGLTLLILPTVVVIYACAGLVAAGLSNLPALSYLVGRRYTRRNNLRLVNASTSKSA